MALTHDTRRALAERVQRRVEGRGIPRHVIDDAIARVGDALAQQSSAPGGGTERSTTMVAVFAASAAPDLASRVRAALQAEAVAPLAMGTSTSGRHTVATVRLAADARAAAERVASRLAATVSFVHESLSSSPSQ
jgi:hypothetical protein